jgi:hypothetical protein
MSDGKVVHSLQELVGARVICIRHGGNAHSEAECLGIDGQMIKLIDATGAGWFSLASFYCVRKVGPNEAEKRGLGAFGLTAEDFQPGAFEH